MPQVHVDLLYVLFAAVAGMIVGAVWYSKPLFAKQWAKATGRKMEDMGGDNMAMSYGLSAVVALIEAYVLAHFVAFAGVTTMTNGAVTGFWAWLGFVVPVATVTTVFEAKGKDYWWITAGYHLAVLVVMGAILAGHAHVVSAIPAYQSLP